MSKICQLFFYNKEDKIKHQGLFVYIIIYYNEENACNFDNKICRVRS